MRLRSGGIRRSLAAFALAAVAASSLGATSVMAQTATPTPGAPPTQLTLSTTYPSITVDPGGTAKFPLQVTSPVVERVDLTVSGAPDGYTTTLKGGGLIVGSVTTTGTDASPPLELDVKVPDRHRSRHHTASPSMACRRAARPTSTVDVVIADTSGGDVSLTTDVIGQRGSTTQTFTFNLKLTNDTAQELTFTLRGHRPRWLDGHGPAQQPGAGRQRHRRGRRQREPHRDRQARVRRDRRRTTPSCHGHLG